MVPGDELARGSSPARGKTRETRVRPAYVFASAAPASERGAVSVEAACAARRPLVDGVRTRERAVAGRLGAAPYAAPSTNVKTSPKSSRTSTNGFGFGFGFGDVFFRRRNRFGFSVSRRLFARGDKLLRRVGRRRRSTPRTGARLFVVSNVAASRVFARHFVRGVLLATTIVVVRVVRVVVLLFVEERRIRRRAPPNDAVRFLAAETETASRRAGDGDGSSRRVSVADRYRTRDGVVDDRFLVCVSRLVRCSIPSPPGPGSNAGRDASSRAVSRKRAARLRSRRTRTRARSGRPRRPAARRASPGRRKHLALDAAAVQVVLDHGSPGKSTFLRTQRRAGSRRIAAVRSAALGRVFFIFSRDVVSPRRGTVRTPGAEDGSHARPLRPPDARAGRSRYVTGRLLERRVSPR